MNVTDQELAQVRALAFLALDAITEPEMTETQKKALEQYRNIPPEIFMFIATELQERRKAKP